VGTWGRKGYKHPSHDEVGGDTGPIRGKATVGNQEPEGPIVIYNECI